MSGAEAGGFAGTLRTRIAVERPSRARDAIGAAAGGWDALGEAWAAVSPAGAGASEAGGSPSALPRWQVVMRDRDLAVGDRLRWGATAMIVGGVVRDPAMPDRLRAIGEECR